MESGDMTVNEKTFDTKIGYYGSEVVAVYAQPETNRRKRRRKRSEGKTVVEVDISVR